MKVAIIGAGRMGQWFVRYFKSKDDTVVISDIDEVKARAVAKKEGAVFTKSNIEAVKDAELVMISVSIKSTPEVIAEIGQDLVEGTIVAEISSIKTHVMKALIDLAQKKVVALSIHPLFGSGARTLKGRKIAVIPVKDSKIEAELVQRLFPEAIIDLIGVEEHDKIMALTLSLPHFLNVIFASTLSGEDIANLKRFAGPSFTLQLILAESMLTESPDIYASIQIMNKHICPYLVKLIHEAKALKETIYKSEQEELISFFERIRESFLKDIESFQPYKRLYEIIESRLEEF
ncbi:MAG: prephenate dehydrogenase/arogenate dehydrogenase family protein [archaeon]|nr:prephenate dehydrogenase/arogenate dehydrogenase family protein [archaeon]